MQILERFVAGEGAAPGAAGFDQESPEAVYQQPTQIRTTEASRPGIEFSDDKNQKSAGGSTSGHGGSSFPATMGIGDGIIQSNNKQTPSSKYDQSSAEQQVRSMPKQAAPPKQVDRQQLNIDKASSLVDE